MTNLSSLAEEVPVALPVRRAWRLEAIDILRGLVLILMAIDHVRDHFLRGTVQDPMGDPHITLGLFLTRWVTHFCAPVFVTLAGVSAGLMTARKCQCDLARFLLTRGLWLILVEVFVVSTLVSFSPRGIPELGGLVMVNMQVIWAIGASMVVLSGLQWFGRRACLLAGVIIIAGHNLLDSSWPVTTLAEQQWPVWVALHSPVSIHAGPFLLRFAYPLLPWIGVMSFGFGISEMFELSDARRNSILRRAGLVLTIAFVAIRALDLYGDPNPWEWHTAGIMPTIMDFLNTTKYPPSLDYLFMTLGPAAIVCSFADRLSGWVKNTLVMFGRVPFAFYIAHFLLIHALSVWLGLAQGFTATQMMTAYRFFPREYGIGLTGVYLVWAFVILVLYPWCRWMARVKAERRDWWLSYL